MGSTTPKQFLKVAGRMVIEHTVEVFEHHQHIDEIAIVVHPDYYSLIEDIVLKNLVEALKRSVKRHKGKARQILIFPEFHLKRRNEIAVLDQGIFRLFKKRPQQALADMHQV